MSQAPSLETDNELLRMAQGLRDALGAPAPVALSRRTLAGFRGKAKMYYYPPKDGGKLKTPLVLFPYLGISQPYIFDLRPSESFAEFLYEQGVPFYLTDWGTALSLGIPFLIGYFVGGGSWLLGLEALVWGGLFRIFLYQHATFSVNSICHMFGRKDYVSRDEARNNWIVALLVFGEGWHNNHHAFPASARHGLHRFQVDVSWWVIRTMERARLVRNVKTPSGDQLARRRLLPSES